jgi:D-arabinose 1-dehydrogenase-like Zn-dependent alcohol dehydrogenase
MLSYQIQDFGKPLAQVLRETPTPTGTEVIVKIGSCGVCHSDVHLHDGYFDLGGGNKLDMTRVLQPPRTPGHEIAGTVVALGPEAKGAKIGDRRVVFPWIGCGTCSLCAAGDEHLCNAPRSLGIQRDGGFSDHVVVPHPKYLVEYGNLPEDEACTYACSGLTAYSALKKTGNLGATDPLLIIGAGGVGLSGVRIARELFPQAPIIVAEVDQSKWEMAKAAGANECIDSTADGAGKLLFKSTGGGVAAAIDFVGAANTFNFGYGALRKAGKLVCVDACRERDGLVCGQFARTRRTDGDCPCWQITLHAAGQSAIGQRHPSAGRSARGPYPWPDHFASLIHTKGLR